MRVDGTEIAPVRRPRRSDGGVTIIEAAIALPVLFLFLMGLVDLGMWTYNSNQSANAARDGARTAIVSHAAADIPSSPDWQAIVDSIEAHLPGKEIAPDEIAISCVRPDGSPVPGGCAAATVDVDRIQVEVEWDWDLVTPIAGMIGTQQGAAVGEASMVIVGRPLSTSPSTVPPPTTTTTTQPCSVSSVTVSAAQAKPNGNLQNDLVIAFTTNGVIDCDGVVVQLAAPGDAGTASHTCGCGTSPVRTWTYGKNTHFFWKSGQATVRILNGASVIATKSFTVN